MAKTLSLFPAVTNLFSNMVHAGLLQLCMVVMAIADRCTRAVPVQEYPAKKVHVLRRVPATCSNWDKAWAWLTKVDCGTKYRLDLVTVPSREVRQYKLQYVCCDGDTDCKEADNIQTPGFDATDEKFLAIVLGSTAACVVIIIIIFAITFYTKKSRCRCQSVCDQGSHLYTSADVEDIQEGNTEEKRQPEEIESEREYKGTEAEYAEICDQRLPRYTDIFKENIDGKENPFNKASAPPMYSAVPSTEYSNCELTAATQLDSTNEIEVIQRASPSVNECGDHVTQEQHHDCINVAGVKDVPNENSSEVKYYNVSEKAKKKRRKCHSGTQGESTNINKGEIKVLKNSNNSETNKKVNNIKSKVTGQGSMKVMVKSSSAQEGIGKMSEASSIQQKRRSAPPGSLDVTYSYPSSTRSASSTRLSSSSSSASSTRLAASSSVIRSGSRNACTIIHEALPSPPRGENKCSKGRVPISNFQQKPVPPTIRGNTSSSVGDASKKTSSRSKTVSDSRHSITTSSSSQGAMLNSLNTTSQIVTTVEPNESDSLLQSSLCHSSCGEDSTFESCEHCSKYDKLTYTADPDSENIYQCLEDVRREVRELRAAEAAATCVQSPS